MIQRVVVVAVQSLLLAAPCGVASGQAPADLAALKANYRRPPPQPVASPTLVELGRELFFDKRIPATVYTSCDSCHFPELGYGVTDARTRAAGGALTSRKSQPLTGMGYIRNSPFGGDGRTATLEAQTKAAIATGPMSLARMRPISQVSNCGARPLEPGLCGKFEAALPTQANRYRTIATAIAAFRHHRAKPAPFDRWIEGDEQAISDSAKRGFVCSTPQVDVLRLSPAGASPTICSTTSAPRRRISVPAAWCKTTSRCNTPSRHRRCVRSACGRLSCTTRRRPRWKMSCGTTKGRHRPAKPLAADDADQADRPGARRPDRIHGKPDRNQDVAGARLRIGTLCAARRSGGASARSVVP